MTQIEQIINEIDDDYLIGMSNKGTVKRAYKDLESCEVKVTCKSEDDISADVSGEKVVIKNPLLDSICSCPSRSICKHRIMAIIGIKKVLSDDSSDKKNEVSDCIEECNKDAADSMENRLINDIAKIDIAKIKKVFTPKQLKDFVATIDRTDIYDINYASAITFKIRKTGELVKLLLPLEHSTCTCSKTGLCVHKAQAMLKCMYDKNIITIDSLNHSEEMYAQFDSKDIKQNAQIIIDIIDRLMRTGLTRVPEDITDTFERIALICHNARLARQENNARTISQMYKQYFKKDLSFNMERLLMKIMTMYRDMQFFLENNDIKKIADRAGELRNEYNYKGELHLIGVSYEHFLSKAGYVGDRVYFLDILNRRWYTYTSMMPIFYNDKDKNIQSSTVYGTYNSVNSNTWGRTYSSIQSPWGIGCSLNELAGYEIVLENSRCDSDNNLSQTKECSGRLEGVRRLDKELLKGIYYESFDKLFKEHVVYGSTKIRDALVFVKAHSFKKQDLNHKNQEYSIKLYDENGKRVTVMIVQDAVTVDTVRELKFLKENISYVFFGRIYIQDGEIYMYPIDVMKESEFE